ncbi:MAG: hypothetical protein WED04_09230 [Promethearchaeati archaeon SRVP18_Atabeyarchaeia-1]
MDIVQQATRIIDEAQKSRVVLRALGGTAIGMRCPSAKHRNLIRDYADIDLVGHAKQDKSIKELFTGLGFEPNKRFNALHGKKRLQFSNTKEKIDVDIFLDVFQMCHKFDFKDRLELDSYTIPLADLLMTKLQVVQINEKDIRDIVVILKDHDYGSRDPDKIDLDYIAKLCSGDWGLWKTLSMNAEKISKMVADYGLSDDDTRRIKSKLASFLRRLEEEPKSMRWRMRAARGESSPWYETVEEVRR